MAVYDVGLSSRFAGGGEVSESGEKEKDESTVWVFLKVIVLFFIATFVYVYNVVVFLVGR